MFYPYGFGLGSHWLLYIGIPLIIGIWAQIRVSSAFRKWGEVRASSNITGAECAREILQAAQISDVDVVETNDFLGDHYDPTSKKLNLSSNVYRTENRLFRQHRHRKSRSEEHTSELQSRPHLVCRLLLE